MAKVKAKFEYMQTVDIPGSDAQRGVVTAVLQDVRGFRYAVRANSPHGVLPDRWVSESDLSFLNPSAEELKVTERMLRRQLTGAAKPVGKPKRKPARRRS